ncbi:MAG: hypothetical protein QNJ07_11765 [Woeseiaceae bacterium]|nr:hypothetical protein [Woeseiaceae bacterium]
MTVQCGAASYDLDILQGSDIAVFRWIGPITLEDRRRNASRMTEFCRKRGVRRIIVDGREQQSETDIMDSYEFGAEVPTQMPGLTLAIVHRPDDESLKFIETVAYNRGSRTRAFQDFEAARAWLESLEE